jgi:fructokinase
MRIGIDLGGTKIAAIMLGPRGETVAERRIATPRDDYSATVDAIGGLVEEIELAAGNRTAAERPTIGIATPGAVSPATGRMKNCNSTWLNGRALKPDLEQRIGREVRLANDANCFALSEARDGAARGRRIVFGVIAGTGMGGGIVVDGRVLEGRHAIAGEWGHNPLPWPRDGESPGPACWCGRRGCAELFLSGPGLARDHREVTGEVFDAASIAARAFAGDRAAVATLERYEDRFARALAALVNVLDPDVIVLGGGLSKIARLYTNVPHRVAPFVFSDRADVEIVPPAHGDASGVRGAAWLWEEEAG